MTPQQPRAPFSTKCHSIAHVSPSLEVQSDFATESFSFQCFPSLSFSASSAFSHLLHPSFGIPIGGSDSAMLLKSASASPLSTLSESSYPLFSSSSLGFSSSSYSSSCPAFCSSRPKNEGIVAKAVRGSSNSRPLTGVVFEPFEEVKKELSLVPSVPQDSLARQKFSDDCENAINEQINVEYNVSYVYHAMFAYFDRDNVALKGHANFFKEASAEEREHAEKLMEYQNKRGGRVKLLSILMPVSEFDHPEKGDALYAMELALALEKLTNEKLLKLHQAAQKSHDVQMADFIETEFLAEQVDAIKKISEYVAQLRRVGKGHGVWHFDQMLLNGAALHPA